MDMTWTAKNRTTEEGPARRALVARTRNHHVHTDTGSSYAVNLILDVADAGVELATRLPVDREDCRST